MRVSPGLGQDFHRGEHHRRLAAPALSSALQPWLVAADEGAVHLDDADQAVAGARHCRWRPIPVHGDRGAPATCPVWRTTDTRIDRRTAARTLHSDEDHSDRHPATAGGRRHRRGAGKRGADPRGAALAESRAHREPGTVRARSGRAQRAPPGGLPRAGRTRSFEHTSRRASSPPTRYSAWKTTCGSSFAGTVTRYSS